MASAAAGQEWHCWTGTESAAAPSFFVFVKQPPGLEGRVSQQSFWMGENTEDDARVISVVQELQRKCFIKTVVNNAHCLISRDKNWKMCDVQRNPFHL